MSVVFATYVLLPFGAFYLFVCLLVNGSEQSKDGSTYAKKPLTLFALTLTPPLPSCGLDIKINSTLYIFLYLCGRLLFSVKGKWGFTGTMAQERRKNNWPLLCSGGISFRAAFKFRIRSNNGADYLIHIIQHHLHSLVVVVAAADAVRIAVVFY